MRTSSLKQGVRTPVKPGQLRRQTLEEYWFRNGDVEEKRIRLSRPTFYDENGQWQNIEFLSNAYVGDPDVFIVMQRRSDIGRGTKLLGSIFYEVVTKQGVFYSPEATLEIATEVIE